MVRRYYRRYPRSNNRDKYSVEQTLISTPYINNWAIIPATSDTISTKQFSISVIPPTNVEGMRKVKHFTMSFADSAGLNILLAYALVYVPEGYDPNTINYPDKGKAISMYEPNQFVLSSGMIDFSNPYRVKCPLARNLNSGDSVYLVLALPSGWDAQENFEVTVKYAITLQ